MATVHQLFEHVRPFVVEVDAVDVTARHHDVFDSGGFQIENAEQHLLMLLRNHGAGFLDYRAQLFTTERFASTFQLAHTEQGQHAVRDPVQ